MNGNREASHSSRSARVSIRARLPAGSSLAFWRRSPSSSVHGCRNAFTPGWRGLGRKANVSVDRAPLHCRPVRRPRSRFARRQVNGEYRSQPQLADLRLAGLRTWEKPPRKADRFRPIFPDRFQRESSARKRVDCRTVKRVTGVRCRVSHRQLNLPSTTNAIPNEPGYGKGNYKDRQSNDSKHQELKCPFPLVTLLQVRQAQYRSHVPPGTEGD